MCSQQNKAANECDSIHYLTNVHHIFSFIFLFNMDRNLLSLMDQCPHIQHHDLSNNITYNITYSPAIIVTSSLTLKTFLQYLVFFLTMEIFLHEC